MGKCPICESQASRSATAKVITCTSCNCIYHLKCVNVSEEDAPLIIKSWLCVTCSAKNKARRRLDSTPVGKAEPHAEKSIDLTSVIAALNEVKSDLKQFREEQNCKTTEVLNAIEYCQSSIAENSSKLSALHVRIDDLVTEIECLKSENTDLKSRVVTLESTVNSLEQNCLRRTLEIHGVPVKSGERPDLLLADVARALGVNCEPDTVDSVFRARRRTTTQENPPPPPIVVNFVRQGVRDEFLQKRKVKRDFSTRDIGWSDPHSSAIYLNESLTFSNKKLYASARDLKKSGKVKYVWIKNGRILLRCKDGDPVVRIKSLSDLCTF